MVKVAYRRNTLRDCALRPISTTPTAASHSRAAEPFIEEDRRSWHAGSSISLSRLQAGIASDPPYMLPSDHLQDRTSRPGADRVRGVSRFEAGRSARWRRLGGGRDPDLSTHNGTHLDAPYHFATTMDGGKRAITIDEVPLEWCFQRGVKLDFRHFPGRLRRDRRRRRGRAETHRAHAGATRHRGREHGGRSNAMASPISCRPAAAWAARRRSI